MVRMKGEARGVWLGGRGEKRGCGWKGGGVWLGGKGKQGGCGKEEGGEKGVWLEGGRGHG